jgi:hypothetical protein
MTVAPVVVFNPVAGLHEKVEPATLLLAVRVTEPPTHIEGAAGVIEQVGLASIFTVADAVLVTVTPLILAVAVAVLVVVPAGRSVRVSVHCFICPIAREMSQAVDCFEQVPSGLKQM